MSQPKSQGENAHTGLKMSDGQIALAPQWGAQRDVPHLLLLELCAALWAAEVVV